ncbi:hypothetical protein [Mucilaginibacter sp. FT3.2]|uniref:hypothetical protein n=1 Tax=Mucilaginibacter sp. FT3.2 TaxID=2723090 RepID=UPI001607001D|nr:hypothetical protein [Mucilaginibacter sp. FT3.2]MBB6231162.1 hypothetical protein [Mucilaginibacter sp. FT3.2]
MIVLEKTGQRISETTIKRFYGFALARFNPSLYTLDTLAKYCNYSNWDDYVNKQDNVFVNPASFVTGLDNLKTDAYKTTGFTLQALKNRSGIPFNMTIKRKFIDHHFDEFLSTRYPATILIAPAGYGKTLALCHWVEDKMALTEANNIILFLSYSALVNAHLCGRDLNEWLFALMGYATEEDVVALLKTQQQKGGHFFLIIDGVDENILKIKQFQLLINQLLDIVSVYQNNEAFKLVLTMRPSTWVNNSYSFETGHNAWFFGNLTDQTTNVPLLNIKEVNELATKINPAISEGPAINVAEVLSFPLYFQHYYKQYKNNFSLNNVDEVCSLQLISGFITDKVYANSCIAEKSVLIRAFIAQMDLKEGVYSVNKSKVIDLINKYNSAYAELIHIGFIEESQTGYDIVQKTTIEFGNICFLEFSIAHTLIFNNDDLFDSRLIQTVNQFLNNQRGYGVIKWYLMHAIKTEQYSSLHLLTKIALPANSKLNIIVFLSDLLHKQALKINDNTALAQYFNQDCNPVFFNYYLGLELAGKNHSKALLVLLKHNLCNQKKILLYATLAMGALNILNLVELKKYISIMNTFSDEDYMAFSINPLSSLRTIYAYFKHGIIKKDCFEELTRFCFNPPVEVAHFDDNGTHDVLFAIGIIALKICQNPKKTIRFIQVVNKHYKAITDMPTGYNFLFKVILMNEYLAIGKTSEAVRIHHLLKYNENSDREQITPFMQSLYNAARVITGSYDKEYCNLRTINLIGGAEGHLFKLYVQAQLLQRTQSDVYNPFYKQLNYDYRRTIRQNQLSAQLFLKNSLVCLESHF